MDRAWVWWDVNIHNLTVEVAVICEFGYKGMLGDQRPITRYWPIVSYCEASTLRMIHSLVAESSSVGQIQHKASIATLIPADRVLAIKLERAWESAKLKQKKKEKMETKRPWWSVYRSVRRNRTLKTFTYLKIAQLNSFLALNRAARSMLFWKLGIGCIAADTLISKHANKSLARLLNQDFKSRQLLIVIASVGHARLAKPDMFFPYGFSSMRDERLWRWWFEEGAFIWAST